MHVLILGAPGAGKGTQGKILADRLGVPKIATGDLLRAAREAGTELGCQVQEYMDQGQLVPDEVIMGIVREELSKPEAQQGAVFDGFPRTLPQADAVDKLLAEHNAKIDCVLLFDVANEELVRRLLRRAQIEGRTDDGAATIPRRLEVYEKSTAPLIAYYAERGVVHRVKATGPVDDIAESVKKVVGC